MSLLYFLFSSSFYLRYSFKEENYALRKNLSLSTCNNTWHTTKENIEWKYICCIEWNRCWQVLTHIRVHMCCFVYPFWICWWWCILVFWNKLAILQRKLGLRYFKNDYIPGLCSRFDEASLKETQCCVTTHPQKGGLLASIFPKQNASVVRAKVKSLAFRPGGVWGMVFFNCICLIYIFFSIMHRL